MKRPTIDDRARRAELPPPASKTQRHPRECTKTSRPVQDAKFLLTPHRLGQSPARCGSRWRPG